jgi:hypothetical protein
MRFRLRTVAVIFVLFSLLFAYAGSYYRLSRRGMREAKIHDIDGFCYLPLEQAMYSKDIATQSAYILFYFPANFVDVRFFGGKSATLILDERVSG